MEKEIACHDVYQASYFDYKNIPINLIREGRRVIFMLPDTPETYRIMTEFNANPIMPLLDYVTHLKKMRAKMIAMRG